MKEKVDDDDYCTIRFPPASSLAKATYFVQFGTFLGDFKQQKRPITEMIINSFTMRMENFVGDMILKVSILSKRATAFGACCTGLRKITGPRLHELAPAARGGLGAGSRNLWPIFLRRSVE